MPVPTVLIPEFPPIGPRAAELQTYRAVKLGRLAPDAGAIERVPKLAAFLDMAAYEPPTSVDYVALARPGIGMHSNDRYGDCVIVGKVHAAAAWSANDAAPMIDASDAETVNEYFRICGPGDNGCVITRVLDEYRDRGLLMQGKKRRISGYVGLDSRNVKLVKAAIALFGGCTIGFNVPREWLESAVEGGLWDTPRSFSFVGGHDVRILGYDATGVRLATWGVVLTMTWRAFVDSRIVDEAYVELSPDWTNDDRLAPSGLDVAKLVAALAAVGGGQIPDVEPPAPPPAPPPIPPAPPVPVPPLPPVLYGSGRVAPVSVSTQAYTFSVPGLLGRQTSVTIPAQTLSVPGQTIAVEVPTTGRAAVAVSRADVWTLVRRFGAKVLPIVAAGLLAGKTWEEIVRDVIEALAA